MPHDFCLFSPAYQHHARKDTQPYRHIVEHSDPALKAGQKKRTREISAIEPSVQRGMIEERKRKEIRVTRSHHQENKEKKVHKCIMRYIAPLPSSSSTSNQTSSAPPSGSARQQIKARQKQGAMSCRTITREEPSKSPSTSRQTGKGCRCRHLIRQSRKRWKKLDAEMESKKGNRIPILIYERPYLVFPKEKGT
jgi:hypothetical protein